MKRAAGLLVALTTSALLSGCEAIAPVAPAPTATRLVILHSGTTQLSSFPFFALSAYLVDSDGLYTNVSDKAQWSSSNPSIVRDGGSGGSGATSRGFSAPAPGTATVLASYQGLAALMPVVVPPFSNVVGPVNVRLFGQGAVIEIGHTLKLTARDQLSNDVSAVASWVSSDLSVATVDRGVVTAASIGTTTITVAFGGGTDNITFSVFPSRFNR